jgi:integrase
MANTTPHYLEAVPISRRSETLGQEVPVWRSGDRIHYRQVREIRLLTIDEMMTGIRRLFPGGIDDATARNYRHFQQGGVAFIRFLIYQKSTNRGESVMTLEDLDRWRTLAPAIQPRVTRLHILEPELLDDFLEWLKPRNRSLWGTVWILRNLGLRYSGMRNATIDLDGGPKADMGSVRLSLTRSYQYSHGNREIVVRPHIHIWEKQTPRDFDLWPDVHSFLQEQQEYVRAIHPSSPWLFPNSRGNQWNLQSGGFNMVMRRWFRKFHRDVFGMDPLPDDLEALSAHKLRHACGTYLVKMGVKLPNVKKILGHQDFTVLDRYVQHVEDTLASDVHDCLSRDVHAPNGAPIASPLHD